MPVSLKKEKKQLLILEVNRFIPQNDKYSLDHGTPSICELFITKDVVDNPRSLIENSSSLQTLEKSLLFKYFGMELPWRNNENDISRIPAGMYFAKREKHKKYGYVFRLFDVPKRQGVLFGHIGNYAGDVSKGFKSDSEGCLLAGQKHGFISRNKNAQYATLSSGVVLKKLQPIIEKQPTDNCLIVIKDPA